MANGGNRTLDWRAGESFRQQLASADDKRHMLWTCTVYYSHVQDIDGGALVVVLVMIWRADSLLLLQVVPSASTHCKEELLKDLRTRLEYIVPVLSNW